MKWILCKFKMCNMMINTLWNDYLDKVSYINHLTDLPFFMYVVRTFKQMFSCCCSCCSVTQLCPPLRCLAFLSFTISRSLLKLMSIESVMPSNYLILCCPLLLLPSIFHSFRVFSSELTLHIRWPKYWSFSYRISPSNEYSRLISFRMDWLDLLAV